MNTDCEIPATKWLEAMRKKEKIKFYNPFDLLLWLHEDMDMLTDVLERRILMKGDLDENNS